MLEHVEQTEEKMMKTQQTADRRQLNCRSALLEKDVVWLLHNACDRGCGFSTISTALLDIFNQSYSSMTIGCCKGYHDLYPMYCNNQIHHHFKQCLLFIWEKGASKPMDKNPPMVGLSQNYEPPKSYQSPEKKLHPQKLTWNLEMMVSNRNLLFQGSIFRFHVCFGGCTRKKQLVVTGGMPNYFGRNRKSSLNNKIW